MSRPSIDTKTERDVDEWRRHHKIPARVTLRFLALLRPRELRRLANLFDLWSRNGSLAPEFNGRRRLNRERFKRVQNERRQRGQVK